MHFEGEIVVNAEPVSVAGIKKNKLKRFKLKRFKF